MTTNIVYEKKYSFLYYMYYKNIANDKTIFILFIKRRKEENEK